MNLSSALNQGTITDIRDDYLLTWVEAFLIDRKAQNVAKGTLDFYRKKLRLFTDYCEAQAVTQVSQITPTFLREFFIYLETKGHNPGGVHTVYRSVKTFLRWFEDELEPENWKNPINKVKPPKVPAEPLDPANTDDVYRMMDVCGNDLLGKRDKAIMLFLLDTGIRASELIAILLDDLNHITGEVLIRSGKGRKPRNVYLGSKSRKAVRAYLKLRKDSNSHLWITDEGNSLTYWGLRQVIRRRAEQAGVEPPTLHSFRRWFALTCLRNGMDIFSLAALMGHSTIQVLSVYLKQTKYDLESSHRTANPVDEFLNEAK